jgi:hypothetical protein
MSGRLLPIRVGGVELLVEVTPMAGSEQTSRLSDASGRVVDAYQQAQEAIIALSGSVADTVSRLGQQAVRPDRVQVEFGLQFTASGNVFVASTSGQATLQVSVGYDSSGPARSG